MCVTTFLSKFGSDSSCDDAQKYSRYSFSYDNKNKKYCTQYMQDTTSGFSKALLDLTVDGMLGQDLAKYTLTANSSTCAGASYCIAALTVTIYATLVKNAITAAQLTTKANTFITSCVVSSADLVHYVCLKTSSAVSFIVAGRHHHVHSQALELMSPSV